MTATGDRFAAMLPTWVPAAERSVNEYDGDAEFDWFPDDSAYRTLAVSVTSEGTIHYAAFLADEQFKCHGRGYLGDGVPAEILDLLRRLYPATDSPHLAPALAVDPSRSIPDALTPTEPR